MAQRGRKAGSLIRDRLVELLYYLKKGYGYDIYKYYVKIWGKVTLRSIYYHLRKGVELEVFKIKKVEEVKGDYSWGLKAKRIIYELGSNANPTKDVKIKKKIEKLL
ncbi:MAG: hypothetical protein JSW73_04165 [Candidatus Woesearchaeota archaeon]|nr:MAG: hypothetical protein JSW73_04165 [Candidatus Woesearchaeota archaeon]